MAMKVRHMRTSKSGRGGGHFHYIDYLDSSGNGQTKMFISKRTKARHNHKIRAFVVLISDGHTHQLKGSQQKGGGTLQDANPRMMERRREQFNLPRGFVDRRSEKMEVVTTVGSRRSMKAIQKAGDLLQAREGRLSNRLRTKGINTLNRPEPRSKRRDRDDDDRSRGGGSKY